MILYQELQSQIKIQNLIWSEKLKKRLNFQIKKYGIKANNLLESIEFILERKF